MNRRILLGAVVIAAGLFFTAHFLRGCMDLPEMIFTARAHPDSPYAEFVRGRIGIVQPSYYRADLYVAYRNLAGGGFSTEEQSALAPGKSNSRAWDHASEVQNSAKEWLEARNRIPGIAVRKDMSWGWSGPYRLASNHGYSFPAYLNCNHDAFRNAVSTLEARTAKLGLESRFVRDWVAAQDEVFANCQQGEHIPSPALPDAPALIRADRDYQIAAAYFYAGNFEAAENAFRKIAEDNGSPWSGIAPYLAARCLIRRATVGREDDKPDLAALAQAEAQLKDILAHSAPTGPDAAAERMLEFVEARLHPQQRVLELSAQLMKKHAAETLPQDLHDYTFLLDKLLNQQTIDPSTVEHTQRDTFDELAGLRSRDDLTDWILTFQLDAPKAFDHAMEKWRQTHSQAWLLVALSKVAAHNPSAPELISAGQKILPASPGYVWASFHVFRLMAQSGNRREARNGVQGFLAKNRANLPRSALNLFMALATALAKNLGEFLAYSQRVPIEGGATGFYYGAAQNEAGPRFDADSAAVLNRMMSISELAKVAKDDALGTVLRRQAAMATWTRAVLLNRDNAAISLVPLLERLLPEAKPYLDVFRAAPSPEARRFSAAYFLLKFPGFRPYITGTLRSTPPDRVDDLHENWWDKTGPCGLEWEFYDPTAQQAGQANAGTPWTPLGPALRPIYPEGKVPAPEFLGHAQLVDTKRELDQMYSLPSAPAYLTAQTLAWAQTHADDSRVPEALHRAVMAARYGCAGKETSPLSRRAFDLLHRRYPNNPWTKKTKYWYGNPR
jgi:hypothetical protein